MVHKLGAGQSALNSIFYGVSTRLEGYSKYRTGLYGVFKSKTTTKQFLNDTFIKNLIAERKKICKIVIDKARVSKGKAMYNVFDKSVSLYVIKDGKKSKRKERSSISHIVFGYEALIIQTTLEILKQQNINIHLLVYDGFVADEIKDLRKIEQLVIDKLKDELPNLQLKFSMDKL